MNENLRSRLENWKWHRGLALDILKSLKDEQLGLTVGKNMGTLGQQFGHIARVQIQYLEGIKNRKIGPVERRPETDVTHSKEKLIELWERVYKEMIETIEGLSENELSELRIDWSYWDMEALNLEDHLQALADHDNLHNGEIIVYLRTHEISFPKSWEPWGL
jgi:uncharacterized damage-inducible protein DinB